MLRSAFFALVLISTPTVAGTTDPAATVPPMLVKKIRNIIAKRMIDPQSVIISNARVVRVPAKDEPLLLVCGEYNAKNRMGGYAGSDDFVYEASYLKGVLTLNLEQRQISFFSETGDRPDFDGSHEGIEQAVRMGYGDRVGRDSQTYVEFAKTLLPYCLGDNS